MVLSFAAVPVHSQGGPPGSYLRSCTHVATRGDTLTADCRRTDGSWGRTALRDVDRCVGDIGNMDGQLDCNLDCNRSDRSVEPIRVGRRASSGRSGVNIATWWQGA